MAMLSARIPALGATALVLAACGYPDFQFGTPGSGGGTTSSTTSTGESSSGATGGGGAGGATSSSTASTGGGGSGGGCEILHAGGGTCEYIPAKACGCDPDEKCSIDDEITGKSKCVLVGGQALPAWSKCFDDADCAAGTWCDHYTNVCKPICNNVGDCPPGAQCLPARQTGKNTPIPGLKICTAHCDPETASPCGANLTCAYFGSITELDCVVTAKKTQGSSCAFADDCDKGLVCILSGQGEQGTCEPWCHPVAELVPSFFCGSKGHDYCSGLDVSVEYGGETYGICVDY